ncbi:MAG: IS1182 family transposase [Myxococcales bacterium]|nr:IS1182 family transposase [Myxococcales bacterium]
MLDVDRLIEDDHPARAIWELVGRLDLAGFASIIGSVVGGAGRPADDPHLLISLWVYAYSRGIGSAREVARRCEHDPAFRWLTGLMVVNHHTLSDFRLEHRAALDELFTQVLGLLTAEGLIELRTVTHDGTKVAADAGGASFRTKTSIEMHLAAARRVVEAMGGSEDEDVTAKERSARERAGRERLHRLERAIAEVARLRASKPHGQGASSGQVRTSTSDPDARIMRHTTGHYALSYHVQISTDAAAGIVVGVAVGQAAPDYEYLAPGVDQVERRLGQFPAEVLVDAGYTSRENIVALHARGVGVVGPWSPRDGRVQQRFARAGVSQGFLPEQFGYDGETDTYTCPEGKRLKLARPSRRTPPGRVVQRYLASQKDCWSCPSRSQCCSSNKRYGRSIVVTTEVPAMGVFRAMQGTAGLRARMGERAHVAEFVNAWLKAKLGLRRFHVRGLAKVGTEALWATLTYNVQQWIRLRWRPRLASA